MSATRKGQRDQAPVCERSNTSSLCPSSVPSLDEADVARVLAFGTTFPSQEEPAFSSDRYGCGEQAGPAALGRDGETGAHTLCARPGSRIGIDFGELPNPSRTFIGQA